MFIRGLPAPSENELIDTANSFSKAYAHLLAESCQAQDQTFAGDSTLKKNKVPGF